MKRYHTRPVLNKLSINVDAGALCILVGDNGVGKTTLLRILAGLVRPDSGEISIGKSGSSRESQHRRMIGYLGHQSMLYQDLNAIENLTHYARLYHLPEAEMIVSESIRSVGLEESQYQMVRTYSRGMQQRLSVARSLLHDPEVLLLDEPYTGLDKQGAQFLDKRLQSLHQQAKTIFLAAHRPHRLLSFASHVAWLKDGLIVEYSSVADILGKSDLAVYLQESA
ncbi:MAG: heme ABC exporter ATP-binding protein CcmA [Brevefilum sp.]|nr:heme ABC exporter ATP-binding protein CcmA [Brevefilum sp.]MDW7754711.1 heme ABC exporter ATP-binding protein CcmA [Brevefilum sp.]